MYIDVEIGASKRPGRNDKRFTGGSLRYVPLLVVSLAVLIFAGACSNKGNNPQPVTLKGGARYFPVQQGNKWFYNNGQYRREISGDTTIAGNVCQRLLENGETAEAWTLTPQRFAQHLLGGFLWFDPPLQIPLDLEKDKPYQTSRIGRIAPGYTSSVDSVLFAGTVTFKGYLSKDVADVIVDSCIQLHYAIKSTLYIHPNTTDTSTDVYDEYYGRGIGLVLLGDPKDTRYLDSAIINGVRVP
jgi:hypothetical protein